MPGAMAIELLLAAEAVMGPGLRSLRAAGGVVAATYQDGRVATWTPAGCEAVAEETMLRRALRWLKADCEGDFAVHEALVAADAEMFGARGREEVLRFKRGFLRQGRNYEASKGGRNRWKSCEVDAILNVDEANRVVVASFECLIPGREGRGTDVMQFDEEMRVRGVAAVRHSLVSS